MTNKQRYLSIIVLLLLTIINTQQQTSLTGTIMKDEKYKLIGPIDFTASDRYVNIQFFVSNNPNLTYTYIQYFQGQSPESLPASQGHFGQKPEDLYSFNPWNTNYFDLQALQMGRRQYVNVEQSNNTGYFKIINLDPPQRRQDVFYVVKYKQGVGIDCPVCSKNTYSSTYRDKCICLTCPSGYQGFDCSRKVSFIDFLGSIKLEIVSNEFRYYRISKDLGNLDINIQLQEGQDIQVYAQYQTYNSEIASYVNLFDQNGQKGLFKLSTKQDKQHSVSFSAHLSDKGKNLLLTILQYKQNEKGEITINLSQKQQFPVFILVIVILFSILACLCCILICMCTFYCCKVRNHIQVLDPPQEILQGTFEKLTRSEVNKYFPQFQIEELQGTSQQSMANIASDKYVSPDEQRQCCICLCPIIRTDLARMGYCRHFYHSTCLIKWLKKQSNCPYCRFDFTMKNVKQIHKQLLIETGKVKLQRLQLIKAIMTYKQVKNLDEKQIDQIQVQV